MIYRYNDQICAYHNERVTIGEDIREKLRSNRDANEKRIIRNIRKGITVNKSSFVKQGSYAMRTMVQAVGNDYDIDDGLLLNKDELVTKEGREMTPLEVRDMVFDAVNDDTPYKKPPERLKNCIRVHYSEGHHVDIPCLRVFQDGSGAIQLAGAEWRPSNPKEIMEWFEAKRSDYNRLSEGRGHQLRRIIRLLKRFSKSRPSWNMPSGLILTMLVVETMDAQACYERDDECLFYFIRALGARLNSNLTVRNLADRSIQQELLTKTTEDPCMTTLRDRLGEAQEELDVLEQDGCTRQDARKAWDWVFRTGGFFEDYDDEHGDDDDGGLAKAEPKSPVLPGGTRRFGHP
jgi:hypothetical protein